MYQVQKLEAKCIKFRNLKESVFVAESIDYGASLPEFDVTLRLTSYVTLDKFLNPSGPHFSHL